MLMLSQLQQLAPAAQAHFRRCQDERQAWARASLDFPEYAEAREAISLYVGFTECTTQVERDLKQVPLQESKQRASLLNSTLEQVMLTNIMAPDVEDICQQTKNGDGRLVVRPVTNYLPDIVKRYHSMFGFKLARKARKKRRDAGLAKDPETLRAKRKQRGQPKPEAEFLRHRDSAIGRMCKAGIEERQRTTSAHGKRLG